MLDILSFFSKNMDRTFFVRFLENSPVTLILRYILCSQGKLLFSTSICLESFMKYSCNRSLFQRKTTCLISESLILVGAEVL